MLDQRSIDPRDPLEYLVYNVYNYVSPPTLISGFKIMIKLP